MTERLYYTDAYLTHFDAQVLERSPDGATVYLDRSAFYPTSGGQPNDVGTLGGVAVIDVIDEDARIAHRLAAPLSPSDAAGSIPGVVEWGRRFDQMQQHTGQHLLSAVLHDMYERETVSVHFGPDYATLDVTGEPLGHRQLLELERRVNATVTENRPVTVSFEEGATAAGLRKRSDRDGTLRIVTIDGLDRSACGGTHVRATGEIGPILLRRQERVRKTTRLEFICGARAVARARSDYDVLQSLAQGMSCSLDELATLVPAQGEQWRASDNERRRLEGELASFRARELHAALVPDAAGVRRWIERRPSGKVDAARALALAFCELPRTLFVVAVDDPPAILVAASEDSGIDAGAVLKQALGAVGGRGGGSPRLAQGSVPSSAALSQVISVLSEGL